MELKLLKRDIHIYSAIRNREDRSRTEDLLVLDGFDVSSFSSASDLWEHFQIRRARFVITDRRFGEEMSGLDLARHLRKHFVLPYVYVLMFSQMNTLSEIEEALLAGVDDYIIKPPNRFQIRSRVLVGLRWLSYVDSINPGVNASPLSLDLRSPDLAV